MRVLQLLVTTSLGGGPRHVWDLVRRLPRGEFEVVVAGPCDGPYFERFAALGVPTVELNTRRLGVGPLRATIRLVRERGIDLVHSHGKGAGLYGRLAAARAGVPAVHTFHGIHYGYAGPGRALYLALERRLSRLTHTVVNVSASQAAEGLALGLFAPGQAVTVVNGIDLDELDGELARSSLRRESLGLAAGDFVVGSVARFDPVKRVETLVRALDLVRARWPAAALVLVGGGAAREERRLRALIGERGLDRRVVVTGPVASPGRIYPLLDLYASASLKEGLPLSVVEAMAARLPVVATDVPGHRDVVVHAETGLLVPPESPAALAEAIAVLAADPERRRRLGEAGRQRARAEFRVATMVERTAAIYRRAVAARRAPSVIGA